MCRLIFCVSSGSRIGAPETAERVSDAERVVAAETSSDATSTCGRTLGSDVVEHTAKLLHHRVIHALATERIDKPFQDASTFRKGRRSARCQPRLANRAREASR